MKKSFQSHLQIIVTTPSCTSTPSSDPESNHYAPSTMISRPESKWGLALAVTFASVASAFVQTSLINVPVSNFQTRIHPCFTHEKTKLPFPANAVSLVGGRTKQSALQFFFGNQERTAEEDLSNPLGQSSGGSLTAVLSQAGEVIRPVADALDGATDGYALSYADLSPETPQTPAGQAFLASNLAYAAAGLFLSLKGDITLGLLTEFCSVASFIYHYTQLDLESKNDTVRFALFIDYVLAFTSIFVGLGYIFMDGQLPPLDGLISAAVAVAFFFLGLTICAEGLAYVAVHSLWHVFSAYCAYLVGNIHLTNTLS